MQVSGSQFLYHFLMQNGVDRVPSCSDSILALFWNGNIEKGPGRLISIRTTPWKNELMSL